MSLSLGLIVFAVVVVVGLCPELANLVAATAALLLREAAIVS
jgi:hypothetical protein